MPKIRRRGLAQAGELPATLKRSSKEAPETSIAAHDSAVRTALSFLESHAAFSRSGRGGVFQVDTEGFVAAAFTHRTSRAGDPQLHSHVLVANKVLCVDGRWEEQRDDRDGNAHM